MMSSDPVGPRHNLPEVDNQSLWLQVDAHDEGVVGFILTGLSSVQADAELAEGNRDAVSGLKDRVMLLHQVVANHPSIAAGDDAIRRMQMAFDREIPDLLEWLDALSTGNTYAPPLVRLSIAQLLAISRPALMAFGG